MKKREWYLIIAILTGVIALFFYQTFLWGKVPFPADILMSDFQPWRSTSYLGYDSGGIPNKAQYPDTIRQLYPWKTLAVRSLREGKLPLWNPYNFSGAPLLANFQSAALYPLGSIYLFLSQIDAWTILIILQPLLAVLFTYLYCRKIGMGPSGSAMSALSYGFSGFMAVWLEYNTVGHVILWLPLMLLAIEHLKDQPRARWLGILALSNTASLLAGHPQVYAYVLTFCLVYALTRTPKTMWGYIVGFCGLGIGIAGLQIIPGAELVALASRSSHDPNTVFTKILIQPWQLLALAFPNIFGNPATRTYWPLDTFVGKVTTIGLVPLFFSLSAFRNKERIAKWYITASFVTLFLITANPVTYVLYRIPIPLVSASSPTLMSFLLSFSLAISCGLGLEYWLTDKHSLRKLIRRTIEVIAVFGVLLLFTRLSVIPMLSEHMHVVIRALLYGAALAALTLLLFWVAVSVPKYRTHSIILLIIVHTLDLFIFFRRFNPFVPKALVFPDHTMITYLKDKSPDRYWGYGTANIAANFASQYGMFSPEGYDPLYPGLYGQFLYGYREGKLMETFDNATRSDAAITSGFGDGGLSDLKKLKILSALSVRYVLDRTENAGNETIYPPGVMKPIYSFENWKVFENMQAVPRAYLARDVRTYPNAKEFNRQFFSHDFDPQTTTLVSTIPNGLVKNDGTGSATISSYEPESVGIETKSDTPAILVLTDTYYPGWIATVDGHTTEILRANWTMRAVVVPAGTHTVVMTYSPKSVAIGIWLSMISIGVTIFGLIALSRKKP